MAFFIESQTGRRIEDPSQADPSKSYVESGTGKQISGSQLKGSLPSLATTGQPTVPTQTTPQYRSGLLGFSDALDQAVQLARQKRNELALGTLKGVLPTNVNLRSTDFSGVLSSLNEAGNTYAEDLLKNVNKQEEILSVDEARILGVPYGTTKADAASREIVPKYQNTPPTGGSLSLTEVDKYGLPRELVGYGETQLAQDLISVTPPQWFRTFQEKKFQQSLLPSQLAQMWQTFTNGFTTNTGSSSDLTLPPTLGQ